MPRLVEDDVHQVLLFVQSSMDSGYLPSVREVEAYGKRPTRRVRRKGGGIANNWADIADALSKFAVATLGDTEVETFVDYLARLGWAAVANDQVRLTSLGSAMLRAAQAGDNDDLDAVVQTTVLENSDPFAYARTLGAIAEMPAVMVVDPYLKLDGIISLSRIESVQRILTGDERRPVGNKAEPFAAVTAASGRDYETRIASSDLLHDRYLVPETGPVRQISSSLNSVGKRIGVITVLSPVASDAVRSDCEAIWTQATSVMSAIQDTTPAT